MGRWSSPQAGLILTALLLAAPAAAQEVTVGRIDPGLVPPDPSLVMPHLAAGRLPSYPASLRTSGRIGYAVVTEFVSARGASLGYRLEASDPAFRDAVLASAPARGKTWVDGPAVMFGVPASSVLRIPFYFNPGAEGGPDASPRLLSVAELGANYDTPIARSPLVVDCDLSLDASGRVVKVGVISGQPKRFYPDYFKGCVSNWAFAPARKAGRPVPSSVRLGVVMELGAKLFGLEFRVPRVTNQIPPEYPFALRSLAQRGDVTLEFLVDDAGRVRNPVVVESSNAGFNKAAIRAIGKWEFTPGSFGDVPVYAHVQLPVVFMMDDTENGGAVPYSTQSASDEPGVRPPTLRNGILPVYPYELLRDGVDGEARVRIGVDRQGRVGAVALVSATRPEFGMALIAAVDGFTFDPRRRDGMAEPAVVDYKYTFDSDAASDDDETHAALKAEKRGGTAVRDARELDHPLKLISRTIPLFPPSVRATEGTVVVEFLVDKQGVACVPRVVSATAPEFGYAALQAVSGWMFEPPTVDGSKVVVRVRVPIHFRAPRTGRT
jgi:TonB family protein